MFIGVVGGLADGLQPLSVGGRSTPIRGTARSLRIGTGIIGAGLFLAGILAAFSAPSDCEIAINSTSFAVYVAALFGFFCVLVALENGGASALQHYIGRLFLWGFGIAPLGYVRFLNEAAERLFLIRRGGSFEFFHVTFRDYMAEAHGPKKAPTVVGALDTAYEGEIEEAARRASAGGS